MNIQAKYRSKKTYYIHGIGLAYEVTFNSSGAETNILYYHYDQLGSTNAITNSSGAVTDRVEYDIYGRTLYRSGTTKSFLFQPLPPLSGTKHLIVRIMKYYKKYQ